MEKNCDTCKHKSKSWKEHPCSLCDVGEGWEIEDEI